MAQLSDTDESVPTKFVLKPVFGPESTGDKRSNYENHPAGNR